MEYGARISGCARDSTDSAVAFELFELPHKWITAEGSGNEKSVHRETISTRWNHLRAMPRRGRRTSDREGPDRESSEVARRAARFDLHGVPFRRRGLSAATRETCV